MVSALRQSHATSIDPSVILYTVHRLCSNSRIQYSPNISALYASIISVLPGVCAAPLSFVVDVAVHIIQHAVPTLLLGQ